MPADEYLGPYKIGELIGRGGMGNVYAARHAKTDELVAVKLIAAHVSDDPRFRRRFDREIRALKMLKHPGIVRIIGEGEDESGRLFYSMELIVGETLQARVRRLKKMSWESTIDIAIQVCSALKHAHDIGVTHRDLKPANLILTEDDRVKIVDFGIPKVFGDVSEQTQAGSVLGTPDYMAPEQANGGAITPRTDLYSLGSVMYAMLLGRAPFKGKNSTEVIDALRRDQPVPLDLVNSELPDDLVALVHQLLEKDPDRRPPTALSVMNRLKAMRNGLQQQATVGVDSSLTDGAGDSSAMDDTNLSEPIRNELTSSTRAAEQHEIGENAGTVPTVILGAGKTVRQDRPAITGKKQESAPEPLHEPPRARYAAVDERVEPSRFETGDEKSTASVWHNLTIAGMIAALIGGAALFYWSSQPPTADQMYGSLAESADLATINTFLRRFPNDPRYAEVLDMQMEQRLSATLRRLSAQAKIGISPLKPAEEGFLTAMEKRLTDPVETASRLSQWIDAFENPDRQNDDDVAILMELAEHEQMVVAHRSPKTIVDPRAVELMSEVMAAGNSADFESAQKKLRGIVETFQDAEWAKSAVDEANRRLKSL